MKMLKGFVIAVFGLFVLITLLSLLLPSRIMIARSVDINAVPDSIRAQVADLQRWKEWHPVFVNNNSITYSKIRQGKGAYAEWPSASGINRLEITAADSNVTRFTVGRTDMLPVENKITLLPSATGNVQVEWSSLTNLKWYPWEKFSGIFLEKITGAGYDSALAALKRRCEN